MTLEEYQSLSLEEQKNLHKKIYNAYREEIDKVFKKGTCWVIIRFDGSFSGFGSGEPPQLSRSKKFAEIDNKPFLLIVKPAIEWQDPVIKGMMDE